MPVPAAPTAPEAAAIPSPPPNPPTPPPPPPLTPVDEKVSAAPESVSAPPGVQSTAPAAPPGDRTAVSPSERPTTPLAPIEGPQSKVTSALPLGVVCPECYARNAPSNLYCQECGSRLPAILTGGRQTASAAEIPSAPATAPPPAAAAPPSSTTLPPPPPVVVVTRTSQADASAAAALGRARRTGTARGFGPADALALLSVLGLGAAVSPLFDWSEGTGLSLFSYQGVNRPGGPGLLPYAGTEWLSVGLVASVALGLALLFLILRVGRGPMFTLAGWLSALPFAYLSFQGLLPLRAQGLELARPLGFRVIFFGGAVASGSGTLSQPSLTPSIWLISGAGLLLLVAGLLAPPRGWGRLATFILLGAFVCGVAFFCAAAYNFNLFISGPLPGLPVAPP